MRGSDRKIRVLCFDFDGVIVDSAALKLDAFCALYEGRSPEERGAIREYCDYHGGVSRQRKIAHIQNNILREPLPQDALDTLAEKFGLLVVDNVLNAPFLPGAREFLKERSQEFSCFVVSGTPHDEIRSICSQRGLTPYFQDIGGSPTEKVEWIERFLREADASPGEAVMIGDAPTDYEAAAAAGVSFIGVGIPGQSQLPEDVPLIPDLTTLQERIRSVEDPA